MNTKERSSVDDLSFSVSRSPPALLLPDPVSGPRFLLLSLVPIPYHNIYIILL